MWPASEFRRVLLTKAPYLILEVKYSPFGLHGRPRSVADSGLFDDEWEIWVRAVARELRHLANCLLQEQGLPAVVAWLRSSEQRGWLSRQQTLELIFNPAEETLFVRQSTGI
jgi:hypothetical protein